MTEGGTAGSVPTVTYYTRLAEALARAMSTVTEDGFCFRVGPGPAPPGAGGRGGELAPVDAAVLRAAAGAPGSAPPGSRPGRWPETSPSGQELLEGLGPFVWRRTLDLAAVEALRDLKMQIDLRSTARENDVKLGPGGIREVEFVAAALQLLHGGRNPALRVRCHPARAAAPGGGGASLPGRRGPAARGVRLPPAGGEPAPDGRRAADPGGACPRAGAGAAGCTRSNFADTASVRGGAHRHRSYVAQAFRVLLGQEARGELPHEPDLVLALDDDVRGRARARRSPAAASTTRRAALASVQRLRRVLGAAGSRKARGPRESRCSCCRAQRGARPGPGAVLPRRVRRGASRCPRGTSAFSISAPAVAGGCSTSSDRARTSAPSWHELRNSWTSSCPGTRRRCTSHRSGSAPSWTGGRRAPPRIRSRCSGRCAASRTRRCCGSASATSPESSRCPRWRAQLTALADGLLDHAVLLAAEHARARWGMPRMRTGRRAPLAVLGLGKLGGRELGYHSDLDLLFVYRVERRARRPPAERAARSASTSTSPGWCSGSCRSSRLQ